MLLVLFVAVTVNLALDGKEPLVRKVSSIPVRSVRKAVLEDVCENGLVLLNAIGTLGDEPDSLRLWDLHAGKLAFQVPMDAWIKEASALNKAGLPSEGGPFRCLNGEKRVIAMQGMYLVLIDIGRQTELTRVLASKDLNDPASPLDHVMWHVTQRTMDVNPKDGLIAAAFNRGLKPRVFVYTADLLRVVNWWELPRYMEDIRWSPDGQKLAVLYSGGFDAKGEFVGASPDFKLPSIPDVEIFDASSGKSLLRFFSGDLEARVAFSSDGSRLYTISLTKYNRGTWKDRAIRLFSAADGTLVRTLEVPPYGVRNNFSLSPNGRLIVADASTPVSKFFLREMIADTFSTEKVARFVILDAETGNLLFEHHEKAPGRAWGVFPMRFGFSPDGKQLLVDVNHAGFGDNAQVDVFSVESLY
jgi:WD40 repeat protein